MLKYALYGFFGLFVVGGYGAYAALGGPGHISSERSELLQVPPSTNPDSYRAAPIIWRTGFHGPAARVIDYTRSYGGSGGGYGGYTPRRRSYGGSGYGGSGRGYGGYGGK